MNSDYDDIQITNRLDTIIELLESILSQLKENAK